MSSIALKIKKLLNLANNAGATEGERDNALRMAHNLLAKHNLDIAEIENSGKQQKEDRTQVVTEFYSAPWTRRAAAAVAKLYFCKYLFVKGTKRHLFIGRKENADVASDIAKWIFKSIDKESYVYSATRPGTRPSFSLGAADVIYMRVEEIIRASRAQQSESKALVLADVYNAEDAANDAFIKGNFKTSPSRKYNPDLDAGAYHGGREFGKTVNLNRQMGGTQSQAKRITH